MGNSPLNDSQSDIKSASFKQVVIHDTDGNEVNEFDFIAATWESSALVTADRRSVYTCGLGTKGELGRREITRQSSGMHDAALHEDSHHPDA